MLILCYIVYVGQNQQPEFRVRVLVPLSGILCGTLYISHKDSIKVIELERKEESSNTFSVTVLWAAIQLGCIVWSPSVNNALDLVFFTDPRFWRIAVPVIYKLFTQLLLFIELLHHQSHLGWSFALKGFKHDLLD